MKALSGKLEFLPEKGRRFFQCRQHGRSFDCALCASLRMTKWGWSLENGPRCWRRSDLSLENGGDAFGRFDLGRSTG